MILQNHEEKKNAQVHVESFKQAIRTLSAIRTVHVKKSSHYSLILFRFFIVKQKFQNVSKKSKKKVTIYSTRMECDIGSGLAQKKTS